MPPKQDNDTGMEVDNNNDDEEDGLPKTQEDPKMFVKQNSDDILQD